ncbi:MAG: glutamine-hydrolyzing GMP synthase [Patescibacteria group bacterium]
MLVVVDFGSQTAHLIGRRLRQLGVNVHYTTPEEALQTITDLKPAGIILSGSPRSVNEKNSPVIEKEILRLGIPILGICYGWQLMAKLLGGDVKNTAKEYGPEKIHIGKTKGVLQNLPEKEFTVIVSHGDTVMSLPAGFETLARTKAVEYTAVINEKEKLYGIQFHPEANHTEYGLEVLRNFATICDEELHPMRLDPQSIIDEIKIKVGSNKVICAVSGGVDSSVAAFLIGKAIGQNLIPVYVSGLMRPETDDLVRYIFSKLVKADLVVIDAKKRFLDALKGLTDPEEKRKTIGKIYIEIFDEQAALHKDATFLGQGTIYSDVIESKGSKHASHIKSHHNVGGLPKEMKLQLLEPVRNYYKDEVREIGRLAGLPEEVVMQHPFPGPGYAVRIRGEVTEERLEQVKIADRIVLDEIKQAGIYDQLFQCFALMTGAYSTAVKGDERVFAEVVGIRAYESVDVMTSHWANIPYEVLQKISSRIVNEVPHVSRVVYDITTKPPATMEWE